MFNPNPRFPYDRNRRRPTATHRYCVPDQSADHFNDRMESRLLNSSQLFRCVPYYPRLIGDVGDITQKMFPFNATVPDVSLSLPRRCVADCYDHMETRLKSLHLKPTFSHKDNTFALITCRLRSAAEMTSLICT